MSTRDKSIRHKSIRQKGAGARPSVNSGRLAALWSLTCALDLLVNLCNLLPAMAGIHDSCPIPAPPQWGKPPWGRLTVAALVCMTIGSTAPAYSQVRSRGSWLGLWPQQHPLSSILSPPSSVVCRLSSVLPRFSPLVLLCSYALVP